MITIITMTRIINITPPIPTTRPITRVSPFLDSGEVGGAVLEVGLCPVGPGVVEAVIGGGTNAAVVDSVSFDANVLAVVAFASEV